MERYEDTAQIALFDKDAFRFSLLTKRFEHRESPQKSRLLAAVNRSIDLETLVIIL
jgi:hypothetical protein